MKRVLGICVLWLVSVCVFAQDAATLAAQREAEERARRLSSEMQELRDANLVQQRRINELINANNALQRQVTDLENRFRNAQTGSVNRDDLQRDLQKVYTKMIEVDKARQGDRTAFQEQIKILSEKVAEIAARPPVTIKEVAAPAPPRTRTVEPTTTNDKSGGEEAAVPDNKEGYFKHKVKQGEYLSTIVAAYNAKLRDTQPNKKAITVEAVKKANPKMNPNNLQVGKEILIPVPADK